MQFYPSYLPPPQQRGFNYKIKPNIIRTQMADGHVQTAMFGKGWLIPELLMSFP